MKNYSIYLDIESSMICVWEVWSRNWPIFF